MALYTTYDFGNISLSGWPYTWRHWTDSWSKRTTPLSNYSNYIINQLVLPELPYEHSHFRIVSRPGLYEEKGWHIGMNGVHFPEEDMALLSANSLAVANYFQNMQEYKSTLGVTIAEFPKTIDLIGSTATRIYKSFKKLRRGDIRGSFEEIGIAQKKAHIRSLYKRRVHEIRAHTSAFDFAANSWLEMQYGWKPLLYEIDNAANDLAQRFATEPADIKVRGSGKTTVLPEATGSIPIEYQSVQGERRLRVGYLGFIRVIDESLRTKSGMGITNPYAIAWELTPLSFVADWFTPVGDWLNSLTASQGSVFIRGSKTIKKTDNLVIKGSKWSATKPLFPEAELAQSGKSFERQVLGQNPSVSDILARPAGFSEALGIPKVITSIALLKNIFRP